jgi:3-oxoacyl-[acyl-carrier-protein] synthase-3
MALSVLNNFSIKAVSASVPKQELFTKDYVNLSSKEKELFIKTTGIETRRVAPKHISTSDLCYEASKELLKKLNWSPGELDAIITVTQSPDYFVPGVSVLLQSKLGASKSCISFDINLGCSGYVYGLFVAGNLLQSGQIKRIILCTGDKSSSSTSSEDKSTYPLFGDAATATALEFDPNADPFYFNLMTDGSGYEAIMIPDGGSRNGVSEETFNLKEVSPGIKRAGRHLQLNGADVFNFALREVPSSIKALYKFSEREIDQTDFFVFHQANKLINESIRKKLGIMNDRKFPYSINKFGNTSSASIPLTLIDNFFDFDFDKKKEFCLCGFGVGLSWASCIFQSSDLIFLPLIELE